MKRTPWFPLEYGESTFQPVREGWYEVRFKGMKPQMVLFLWGRWHVGGAYWPGNEWRGLTKEQK